MNVGKSERQLRAAYGDAIPGSARRNARADAWAAGLTMCRHCTATFPPDEGCGSDKSLCAEHAAKLEAKLAANLLRLRREMQNALVELEALVLLEVPNPYEEVLEE